MQVVRSESRRLGQLKPSPDWKDSLLILPGGLQVDPGIVQLPAELAANLPGAVICTSCDWMVERLLNQAGVAVLAPIDPLAGLPDRADVSVDFPAGTVTESATGRRFAVRPLSKALVSELGAARGRHG